MMITNHEILDASILIVDDRPANVELLEDMLRATGYTRIATTTSPVQVRELHRQSRFDLILLDLQMPHMDGFEVMQGLTEDSGDGYVPVIVLTVEPALKLRALQAGAKDFISKPFDILEAKTRIRNMIEVRLLYRRLEGFNQVLEETVRTRTRELSESEERFRRLTELSCDWYWEQNDTGAVTRLSGPVQEMLGMGFSGFLGKTSGTDYTGWIETEREALQAKLAARQPFLDFPFSRIDAKGVKRHFRVSGEPIFDSSCNYQGYRGVGVEFNLKELS